MLPSFLTVRSDAPQPEVCAKIGIDVKFGAPVRPPSLVLLLHGYGGSGNGSVRLLEEALRERGFRETEFLRPTIPSSNRRDPDALQEVGFLRCMEEIQIFLGDRHPDVVIGFSLGGLFAALLPIPSRLCVAAPYHLLPDHALKAISWDGLRVLQGELDSVVPSEAALNVLPPALSVTRDPEGTHDFDQWMDRIANWVLVACREESLETN